MGYSPCGLPILSILFIHVQSLLDDAGESPCRTPSITAPHRAELVPVPDDLHGIITGDAPEPV